MTTRAKAVPISIRPSEKRSDIDFRLVGPLRSTLEIRVETFLPDGLPVEAAVWGPLPALKTDGRSAGYSQMVRVFQDESTVLLVSVDEENSPPTHHATKEIPAGLKPGSLVRIILQPVSSTP
jgi:hypothetical protein